MSAKTVAPALNIKVTVGLTPKQIAIIVSLVQSEARRMCNVPPEERTPLFQERLDDLDWTAHLLDRAVRL